jgi:chromosome segregation ATPase
MPTRSKKAVQDSLAALHEKHREAKMALREAELTKGQIERQIGDVKEAIKSAYASEKDVEALETELYKLQQLELPRTELKIEGMKRRVGAVEGELQHFTADNYEYFLADLEAHGEAAEQRLQKAIHELHAARAEWLAVRKAQEDLLNRVPHIKQSLQHVPAPDDGLSPVIAALNDVQLRSPIRRRGWPEQVKPRKEVLVG